MKANKKHLPFKISEYIAAHFKEDFLFEVKEVKQVKEHWYYTIEVSKDGYLHTLRFDENGELLKDETDLAFPAEIQEEPTPEDIPE